MGTLVELFQGKTEERLLEADGEFTLNAIPGEGQLNKQIYHLCWGYVGWNGHELTVGPVSEEQIIELKDRGAIDITLKPGGLAAGALCTALFRKTFNGGWKIADFIPTHNIDSITHRLATTTLDIAVPDITGKGVLGNRGAKFMTFKSFELEGRLVYAPEDIVVDLKSNQNPRATGVSGQNKIYRFVGSGDVSFLLTDRPNIFRITDSESGAGAVIVGERQGQKINCRPSGPIKISNFPISAG